MSDQRNPAEGLPAGAEHHAGLSTEQVLAQRQHSGFNDIVPDDERRWQTIARDTARDPMLWFLVFTAGLFGLIGETSEALTLLVAVVPLLGMDAWLHSRTAASSAGLASRLASSARVRRDGQWQDIAARELVPGDLVEVRPGEYFPADGRLVHGEGLQVDNSTLTGESFPVVKHALEPGAAGQARVPDDNQGTAGTRLLTGTAWLQVVGTGSETRYGEIVRSATQGQQAVTPLQQAIGKLVSVLLVAAVAVCIVLAGIRVWQGYGWADALISALTLAVAAIPEEFPVVYTFFLGVGVFRLARKNALVRRGVAVENIGRITCILSDKTGTITAGTLVFAHGIPAGGLDEHAMLRVAAFAARPDSGDPMDEALHAAAGSLPPATRQHDFPFTEARRRETSIFATSTGARAAYAKGAPETVLALCKLSSQQVSGWLEQVNEQAASGRKVIACAWKDLPAHGTETQEPSDGFTFAGLLAFEDPVRDGVREAVTDCLAADMRVIMVTGDHPATARAIARSIGLGGKEPVVVVLQENDAAENTLRQPGGVHVVARATPTQKLALVRALQAQGELVAVTGDGVNDVPALRQADIGIAMGARGTRSAREVAPVVLLDDNFRTIVDAISEGRQLFQNLRLAFTYLLLVHIPLVIGAAAIPLMGLPLLFLPVHIVWLELVIHPTAMLAFQGLPADGPLAPVQRHPKARFFSARAWLGIGLLGSAASLAVVGFYLHALGADQNIEHARAMALATLMAMSAAATTGLTLLRQTAARWLVAATLISLAAAVQIPAISRLLGLQPLHATDWALVAAAFLVMSLACRTLASALRRGQAR